jgi:hypothetical protein
MEPFPAWAYEVLFVNKRLAVVDPAGKPAGRAPTRRQKHPLFRACQASAQ